MPEELNIDQWDRKEHFHFFKDFDQPFFGVTTTIDCTTAYQRCKENGHSFFLYYLYQSLKAANQIKPFSYRIHEGKVLVYDQVNASPTINRPNGTFGFAYMDYFPQFDDFLPAAATEIERIQQSTGLAPSVAGENVIHYSAIPWVNFTALSHASNSAFKDSCPKISFGKMSSEKGRKQLPVSIHVHHALMDGYHVGLFVDAFQTLMNQP